MYREDAGSETLKLSIPDPHYLGQYLALLSKVFFVAGLVKCGSVGDIYSLLIRQSMSSNT